MAIYKQKTINNKNISYGFLRIKSKSIKKIQFKIFCCKDVFGRLAGVHALKDEAGTPFTIGDVFNVIGKPTGCQNKIKMYFFVSINMGIDSGVTTLRSSLLRIRITNF